MTYKDTVLGKEELKKHAAELAAIHKVRDIHGKVCNMPDIGDRASIIEKSYNRIVAAYNRERASLMPASEWLMDNYHIVKEQAASLKELDMRHFTMPLIEGESQDGHRRNRVRAYVLAEEIVAHTDGRVDEDSVVDFLDSYRQSVKLSTKELYMFETMLRIALFKRVSDICKLSDSLWEERKRGEKVFDILAQYLDGESGRKKKARALELWLADMSALTPGFCESLLRMAATEVENTEDFREILQKKLAGQGTTIDKLIEQEHTTRMALGVSMGNAISSLTAISSFNWDKIIAEQSSVTRILAGDPAGIFSKMNRDSKAEYVNIADRLARDLNVSPESVAMAACELSSLAEEPYMRHVGYYLYDKGVMQLKKYVAHGVKLKGPALKRGTAAATAFISSTAVLTAVLSFVPAMFILIKIIEKFQNLGARILLGILLLIPLVLIVLNIATRLLQNVFSRMYPPVCLPGLDYSKGIPDESRVMVIIPALLTDCRRTADLVSDMEKAYFANRDDNIFFAIVGDLKDASQKNLDTDYEIIREGVEKVKKLNKKFYGNDAHQARFFFLYRERIFHKKQNKWMGRERKRGAVLDFNSLITGRRDHGFKGILPNAEHMKIKYVLTVDEGTILSPGSVRKMAEIMAHPLQRPRIENVNTTSAAFPIVTGGYGVLQPAVLPKISRGKNTFYNKIFSPPQGRDSYAGDISDFYFDVCREGVYTGKGMYDPRIFNILTENLFPDEKILSHDLIEGSFLRCAFVGSVRLYDSYPKTFKADLKRLHRWTRGDWQLLPYTRHYFTDRNGKKRQNPLNFISHFKITDNLVRSLFAPSLLYLLIHGLIVLPRLWILWLAVLLLGVYLPFILMPARRIFVKCTMELGYLPFTTYAMWDAIIRALWRQFVSKKNMLEWVTAAQTESAVKSGKKNSTPEKRIEQENELKYREEFYREARLIWAFYEDYATGGDNFLPPDNVQFDPVYAVAHRTSPTNIGFYMLSTLEAEALGFINAEELTERLEQVLSTIERLEKWNGHLLNWYDTISLYPLSPVFVSTVDSGNFLACLITVRQGLKYLKLDSNKIRTGGVRVAQTILEERSKAGSNGETAAWQKKYEHAVAAADQEETRGKSKAAKDALRLRLEKVIDRIRALEKEMDFSLLYNPKKRLFSTGYIVAENKLANAYYDMAVSEARLTSYLAIAKGDVEPAHFDKLARRYEGKNGGVLLSWSGTGFEYLMPELFFSAFPGSLWDLTIDHMLDGQMRYAAIKGLPWGISESGYNAMDVNLNYKYKAIGVPGLGLKYEPDAEPVISPYTSIMAVDRIPEEVRKNLTRLRQEDAYGPYGYFEAVDYTKSRAGVVRSVMAHHLGMSLAALCNYLADDYVREMFGSSSMVASCEILLAERPPQGYERAAWEMPAQGSLGQNEKMDIKKIPVADPEKVPQEDLDCRKFSLGENGLPGCDLLSNGKYTCVITSAGSGISGCDGKILTKPLSQDGQRPEGVFFYVRNITEGTFWSAAKHPVPARPSNYKALFFPDRAVFCRQDGEVETELCVCVSPEENAEVRRLSFTNNGSKAITLEVTGFCEIVLAGEQEWAGHPAFSDIFITTETEGETTRLIAKRNARTAGMRDTYGCMVLARTSWEGVQTEFDSDLSSFLGRNRDVSYPAAEESNAPLAGQQGAVLTPCFALRTRIQLAPGGSERIYFTLGYADEKAELTRICDKFSVPGNGERAFELARTRCKIESDVIHITPEKRRQFLSLLPNLLFKGHSKALYSTGFYRHSDIVRSLWQFGISGDFPIISAFVKRMENSEFVLRMIKMWQFYNFRGLSVDLVIVTDDGGGYLRPLKDLAENNAQRAMREVPDVRGKIHVISTSEHSRDSLDCIAAAAQLVLKPERKTSVGDRAEVSALPGRERMYGNMYYEKSAFAREKGSMEFLVPLIEELKFYNGFGGFSKTGEEYVIIRGRTLPAPWINCIATENFGFIISETGGGSVWNINSRENRLTPWSCDIVRDMPNEVVYVRNDKNGRYFSATPQPCGGTECVIRHGFGYSLFEQQDDVLQSRLTVFTPLDAPVKFSLLQLTNTSAETVTLSLFYYFRPVLGNKAERMADSVISSAEEFSPENGPARTEALLFNRFRMDCYGALTAFAACSSGIEAFTCDDLEFRGAEGSLSNPAALLPGFTLSGRTGAGLNTCCAIKTSVVLKKGESASVLFALGETFTDEQRELILRQSLNPFHADRLLQKVKEYWRQRLSVITVETPDPALNFMINGWLLYQVISCRINGRTAFYQSGGAFGFRDQLQDSLALLDCDPARVRQQILLHCARQFEEGDVQHWWHPPTGAGIRSRCSDDLLWLPYVTARYVEHTGDESILQEQVPFIKSPVLEAGEAERYETPDISGNTASVYEHCALALALAYARKFGPHGLPLIGTCDWNDGMSNVGIDGTGESVWLAWFLCTVSEAMGRLARIVGKNYREYFAQANTLAETVEREAWDENRYIRAFYDDGTPIGAVGSKYCAMDSITQSWSAISGKGDPERVKSALETAEHFLVNREDGVIRLLTPPFRRTPEDIHDPGYISAYPPGIRENGAQYTHGAVWLAKAFLTIGETDKGFELLSMINPVNHARTSMEASRYRVEPYVVAADVYSDGRNAGRGGWSWYTGSASWLYRTIVEDLLGIRRRGKVLEVVPSLPSAWNGYKVKYKYGTKVYNISVKRGPDGTALVEDGHIVLEE